MYFRSNYQEAFTGSESQDTLKSEGVDKARGLVFSLDTMQSYLVTKRRRHLENIPINSFLIKLHQPGRITNNLYIKDSSHDLTKG